MASVFRTAAPSESVLQVWGIEGEFKDMPAFAPEWVFHLQLMNNSSFWSVLRYFFRFGKFPSWDLIPSLYTDWFENWN